MLYADLFIICKSYSEAVQLFNLTDFYVGLLSEPSQFGLNISTTRVELEKLANDLPSQNKSTEVASDLFLLRTDNSWGVSVLLHMPP